MHPDPLVDTRTEFSDGSVRSGNRTGPAQGSSGRIATWLERSVPGAWTGLVESTTRQDPGSFSEWKGAPSGYAIDGSVWTRVGVELHVEGERVTGASTDLRILRTPTGFRVEGTWLGAPWEVEVTAEAITRRGGGMTRTWTRIDPGLYAREGRTQVRARFQGTAADPVHAPLPEAGFAVLLSGL